MEEAEEQLLESGGEVGEEGGEEQMTMEAGGEVGSRKADGDEHFEGVEIPETAHLISRGTVGT